MDNFVMGVLDGKKDIRDWKIKKKVSMAIQYPESYELKTNKIKNQGSVGSCVAHASSEILEYHDGYNNTLSTNFIYGIHKALYGSKGPGMYLREACKIIVKYGDPKEEYCKGNTEVDKVYSIADETFINKVAMEDAGKHKMSSYAKVSSDDDIKYALMNYGPVLASVQWYKDNKCDKTTGILTKGTVDSGGHAIMIYGWNKNGWLCQNSWGTSWGKNGKFILPSNYPLKESYSIVPTKDDSSIQKPIDYLSILYKIINFILNLHR